MVRDYDSLLAWLQDKPPEWARVLALRSALRVLPALADAPDRKKLYLAVFRATATAWVACGTPLADAATAARAAEFAADAAASAAFAAPTAAAVARAAAHTAFTVATDAAAAAAAAADAANSVAPRFWSDVRRDIAVMEGRAKATQALLRAPLWGDGEPSSVEEMRRRLFPAMLASDANAWVWRDWYQRRLVGSGTGSPSESDDDVAIRRVVEQDEAFWTRGPNAVNAEIAGWIEEARARALLPEPEPQNPAAPVFTSNAEGRIDLDRTAGGDSVRRDEEAIDRHGEARAAAERAVAACSGNAATATRGALERYRDALGDAVEMLRPGQLIQRGEALRQELAARERDDPDSQLWPLPEAALLALREAVVAHNLLVGLDSALARRDEMRLGPDALRAQVSPERAREIVDNATRDGVVTPDARDAIETAAELAPAEPDPANRHSRQLTETVRNFGRKVVALLNGAIRAPVRVTATTVVAATAGAAGTALGVAAGAAATAAAIGACYKLGQWALKNEQWFRDTFAGNETMLRVIDHVMAELRKLPLN